MTATGIKSYSSTPASNSSATPNGAPEGMAPSAVNDVMRQMMAEIRRWYEDPAWIDYGYTYTYVSGTSFKISGSDQTAIYVVGRRVRAVGTTTGTIYGTIATSAFSTDTTVTVTWDSGTLSSETLAVSVGMPALGSPINAASVSAITVSDASITTTDITTNNVSSTKHGFAPKSPADATKFLNGAATPAYATVKDSDLAFTDVTTNNVTSSAHGYAPKGDGSTTKFLNANGAYSTVTGLGTVTASSTGKVVLGAVTIQWGTGTINSASTFGTAFSGTPYSVVGNSTISGNAMVSIPSSTWSSSGFTSSGGSSVAFCYIATGPT